LKLAISFKKLLGKKVLRNVLIPFMSDVTFTCPIFVIVLWRKERRRRKFNRLSPLFSPLPKGQWQIFDNDTAETAGSNQLPQKLFCINFGSGKGTEEKKGTNESF